MTPQRGWREYCGPASLPPSHHSIALICLEPLAMTDSVQLVTTDDPPVTLTVSRATLVAQSKVFADLLSLPVGDSSPPSLTLTETKAALEPFLSVLTGETGDDAKYRSPDFSNRQTLAFLADKYDSPIHRRKLLSGNSPNEALSLATYTGPPSLIKTATLAAIKSGWKAGQVILAPGWEDKLASHAPHVWQGSHSLALGTQADWLTQLRHIASDIAVEHAAFLPYVHAKWGCTCCGATDHSRRVTWQALLFAKICHIHPVTPFTAEQEELPGICGRHQEKYMMEAGRMNSQYNDKAPKLLETVRERVAVPPGAGRAPLPPSLHSLALTLLEPLTMSDSVLLVTSDDPPVNLTASRTTLTVQSRVFRDLLAMPSSASSEPAQLMLAETEAEIQPFLSVLSGEEGDDASWCKLDDAGWLSLAKLADKYDSPIVRHVVRIQVWYGPHSYDHINRWLTLGHRRRRIDEAGDSFPALSLATHVGPASVIKAAALSALAHGWNKKKGELAPGAADRLDTWIKSIKAIAAAIAVEHSDLTSRVTSCRCVHEDGVSAWQSYLWDCLRAFDPRRPFPAENVQYPYCSAHRGIVEATASNMNVQYEQSMPPFPF
ncbi:hypothetical protein OF846_002289 [Rhodotorula toruloides]|nr:hypothetical protein OF846_002289 [Rhodotorula toruloides]